MYIISSYVLEHSKLVNTVNGCTGIHGGQNIACSKDRKWPFYFKFQRTIRLFFYLRARLTRVLRCARTCKETFKI